MIGSISAEFRKLRQRPAFLVSVISVAAVVALVYTVGYLQATHPTAGQRFGVSLDTLYPSAFVANIMSIVPGLLGAIAIVLGAIVAGSEFQWGTIKTQLIQGPGRMTALVAKFVIVAIWMAVLSGIFFVASAAASAGVALLQQHAIIWPAATTITEAAGASWLIMYCYAMLGAGLAFVFRQSAAALGVGLIYVVVIQTILVGFLGNLNGGSYRWVTRIFDGQNADSLVQWFSGGAHAALVGPTQAMIVIAAYIGFFAIIAGILVRRRDIA